MIMTSDTASTLSDCLHRSNLFGITEGSQTSIPESIKCLSANELRSKLKSLQFDCGPVTPSTLRVLQKKYFDLRRNPPDKDELRKNTFERGQTNFPPEIKSMFRNQAVSEDWISLEPEMSKDFTNPDKSWRDGNTKKYFNYILLDPRRTKSLPLRITRSVSESMELFRSFISAIIYIGKGCRTRPYEHLYDADNRKSQETKKIRAIRSIWNDGRGVISLHIFQNTISVEAYTREACMISAIGLDNLCNDIHGAKCYGSSHLWPESDRRKLGCILLNKAYKIFLLEGERQLRPADL